MTQGDDKKYVWTHITTTKAQEDGIESAMILHEAAGEKFNSATNNCTEITANALQSNGVAISPILLLYNPILLWLDLRLQGYPTYDPAPPSNSQQ